MSDYTKVPTSAEVWAVIRVRHPEMIVFSSYSAPDGDRNGNPQEGVMQTSYGFGQGDYPVIEMRSSWDIEDKRPNWRDRIKNQYWLCVPKKENEA